MKNLREKKVIMISSNFSQIYLILLLTVGLFLLWLAVVAVRRPNIICLRRMNKGGVGDEGFWEEWIGIVVISSKAELRRRLWFDETQDVQADAIPPRRRRFFVGFFIVVPGVVIVFWWFWIDEVERGRDEILGVELFRRV